MASNIDASKQSFNSPDHEMFLEAPYCSHAAFSNTSTAPNNYEALQYSSMISSPQCHNPHMSSHIVDIDHVLDSPSSFDNCTLQQEDSCMLLSYPTIMPASSALSDPMDIMVCDIWSLVGEPPLQLDATHKPNHASHTPNEISFQEDLQLPPPPSPPMDIIQANSTSHSATVNNTHSSRAHLKHSSCKYFAKKTSEIINKPFTLSSSSSEFQRSMPVCNTGGLKDNAEKDDNIAPRMLRNLLSERRRRKKYNDKLYSLRALVPKISKMDKASIVRDAIEYVQDLQKQVAFRQQEISSLQSRLDSGGRGAGRCQRVSSSSRGYPQHKILKMDVVKMEEGTYQLIIECVKGKWAVMQLTRALEALHFDILSANITSIGDRFLNTLVLQAKMLKSKELREIILEIIPKFGLVFI